jgi:hypothetical protein
VAGVASRTIPCTSAIINPTIAPGAIERMVALTNPIAQPPESPGVHTGLIEILQAEHDSKCDERRNQGAEETPEQRVSEHPENRAPAHQRRGALTLDRKRACAWLAMKPCNSIAWQMSGCVFEAAFG